MKHGSAVNPDMNRTTYRLYRLCTSMVGTYYYCAMDRRAERIYIGCAISCELTLFHGTKKLVIASVQ
jgi:hypothetical protein